MENDFDDDFNNDYGNELIDDITKDFSYEMKSAMKNKSDKTCYIKITHSKKSNWTIQHECYDPKKKLKK